jgi:hypothetical protein
MILMQQLSLEHKTEDKMLEELYMQDLANAMRMPEEVVPVGTVTVSASEPEMAGMDKAFVGTRLNVPKPGQPTQQDREKMAIGLLDTLAGALRGAAAQVGGLPGDIRSILDMINQEGAEKYLGQRSFATTEEILADTSVRIPGTQIDVPFPPVLKEGVPNREERQKAVDVAQEVGTFLPAPGAPEAAIQGVKGAVKAIKATKNMPIGMSIQDVSGVEIAIPKAPKIESKAFKSWFGESKVVDKDNKPTVVYHGPGRHSGVSDFSEFKTVDKNVYPSDSGGAWFATNREYAEQFSGEPSDVYEVYLSLKKPLDLTVEGDKTITQWLSIMKKQGVDTSAIKVKPASVIGGSNAKGEKTYALWELLWRADDGSNNIPEELMRQGFDGIKAQPEYDSKTINWVVFDPKNIKSVKNIGTFDPKNPNMLLGAGGAGVAATQEENK